MKTYKELVADSLKEIPELFPWDLDEKLQNGEKPLIVDVREQNEYDFCHIEGSLFVPRGILEGACDWGYDDTIPELVQARDREVVVVCRSGNRSALAAHTMKLMGYGKVISLKTGIRGWNDAELPLVNKDGEPVDPDDAEEFLASKVRPEQMPPE